MKHINAFATLSILMICAASFAIPDADLLNSGFFLSTKRERDLGTSSRVNYGYSRHDGEADIFIRITTYNKREGALKQMEFIKGNSSLSTAPDWRETSSGLPLGESSLIRVHRDRGIANSVVFVVGNSLVDVSVTPGEEMEAEGRKQFRSASELDQSIDGFLRLLAGDLAAKQFSKSPTRISSWASARSGSHRLNRQTGAMAATVRGKEIIFPIGADRVKVDGEWVEIDGLVGFDGTDAVLPKSVLDKLLD